MPRYKYKFIITSHGAGDCEKVSNVVFDREHQNERHRTNVISNSDKDLISHAWYYIASKVNPGIIHRIPGDEQYEAARKIQIRKEIKKAKESHKIIYTQLPEQEEFYFNSKNPEDIARVISENVGLK